MVDPQKLLEAIQTVLPKGALHGHHDAYVTSVDFANVKACLDIGVTNYFYINRFEEELQRICKVNHAIAVSSGTAALTLALRALEIRPGDKIAVPSMTFIGSVSAIRDVGAVPVFIDSNEYGMSATDLMYRLKGMEQEVKAVVPVHLFGQVCNIGEIIEFSNRYGRCPVVEDAAEALGSSVLGNTCGSMGKLGILSFNANKIVTCGGGGAVLTNDSTLASKVRHMATTARLKHPWKIEHDACAWNYRMPNINAALGYGQLRELPYRLAAKRALAVAYAEAIKGVDGVSFLNEVIDTTSNYWLSCIKLVDAYQRDEVLALLHENGIQARAAFTPMHKLPMFRQFVTGDFPLTNFVADRIICLPSGVGLGRRFL